MSKSTSALKYTLIIPRRVEKQLEALDKKISLEIIEKLKQLADCSPDLDVKKLAGFTNLYRLRQGQYRAIYESHENKLIILVIMVGHRGIIYKQLKQLF